MMTTIVLPSFSGRWATCTAAARAAPEERPTRIPSSVAARRGIPARSDYSASKFAVQGFSDALRAELAKDGVDVLVVHTTG